MASWASAEPRLGPLQNPKSELPPRRNASFCFGCVFSCALVLAALGLLLGLLLLRFWPPKWVQIGPEVDPEATQKWDPKLIKKTSQNGTPKRRWKLKISGQNGPRALQAFWPPCPLEVPCLHLDFSLPLRWPKSHFLTPTCAKCGP